MKQKYLVIEVDGHVAEEIKFDGTLSASFSLSGCDMDALYLPLNHFETLTREAQERYLSLAKYAGGKVVILETEKKEFNLREIESGTNKGTDSQDNMLSEFLESFI